MWAQLLLLLYLVVAGLRFVSRLCTYGRMIPVWGAQEGVPKALRIPVGVASFAFGSLLWPVGVLVRLVR